MQARDKNQRIIVGGIKRCKRIAIECRCEKDAENAKVIEYEIIKQKELKEEREEKKIIIRRNKRSERANHCIKLHKANNIARKTRRHE